MVGGEAFPAGRIVALLAPAPALATAVQAQSRPPAAVVRAGDVMAAAVQGADAEWLWLLDGTALPRPDALEELVAAMTRAGREGRAASPPGTAPAVEGGAAPSTPGADSAPPARAVDEIPAPVLLVSRVVDAAGVTAPGYAPWPRRMVTELALRSAVHRLLPVRAAGAGSLLVRVDAARRARPPAGRLSGRGAALEWTGRILRDGMGYLVGASVADAVGAVPDDAAEDVRVAAAMLAGGGWAGKERVALIAEAAGRAAAAVRERPACAAALVREAVRGASAAR